MNSPTLAAKTPPANTPTAKTPWVHRIAVPFLAAFLLCSLGLTRAVAGPKGDTVVGRFVAEERSHGIALAVQDGVLSGRITWTRPPSATDDKNPNPKLRSRKVAGLQHIRGFSKNQDGVWVGGALYNPDDGKTYEAQIWLDGKHRLVIQGRPKIPLIGGLLGRLFGRIIYTREGAH